MKWNIACANMTGTAHLQNNEKCQDIIWQHVSNQFACVTMADGAGSVPYATEGATIAVEASKRWLEQTRQDLFDMDADTIRKKTISHLWEELGKVCHDKKCPMADLSTTLLFLATNGKRLVAVNIGDGLVGRIGNDGRQEVILGQEHSKYVNESFFITDPNCEEKLRVFIGSYDPDSTYFLLTDGSCECLLNDRDGTYAPALHTFTKWMWKYPHHAVSKAIGQKMYSLFPKRTDDDCAIALINLPNPSSNDEPDV